MANDIREITKLYLKENLLPVIFLAKKTGIDQSKIYRWLRDGDYLSDDNLEKVKKFLNGDFLKTVQKILEEQEERNNDKQEFND